MWFFILLLLCFICWPIIKGWLLMRRVRKASQQAFEQAAAEAEARRRANRPGGWSREPSPRSKKIYPNEGEYVEWEEIAVTSQSATSSTTDGRSFKSESQITDAEWVDIKIEK